MHEGGCGRPFIHSGKESNAVLRAIEFSRLTLPEEQFPNEGHLDR
jgi:hypothetical protein